MLRRVWVDRRRRRRRRAGGEIGAAGWAEGAGRGAPCRVQRLPGLPSSNLLLESLTGELDDFGVEAYVGDPSAPEAPQADLHSQARRRRT